MTAYQIPAAPGNPHPLGRHVNHDHRSFAYRITFGRKVALQTLGHRTYGLPLDQGQLGSCTGNAVAGACNTVPVHSAGEAILREGDAVAIYHAATNLDPFEGAYPPEDTGSDGTSACKAAVQLGYIKSYRHCFSLDDTLQALQRYPVIVGVNWYEQMFDPTADFFVRIGGQVAGGHEFLLRGYVAARKPYVLCMNSWGPNWALGGKFKLFVTDLQRLLDEDGDATVVLR